MFLRWFVDFSHSPKMKKKLIDGDVYYWINYEAVLKDLPILNVGKYQLRRRILEHLVDTKVLKHKQVREKGPNGGTFSYYAFGEAYDLLIEDDADKPQNPHKAAIPCGEKVTPPVPEMQQQRPFLSSCCSTVETRTYATLAIAEHPFQLEYRPPERCGHVRVFVLNLVEQGIQSVYALFFKSHNVSSFKRFVEAGQT